MNATVWAMGLLADGLGDHWGLKILSIAGGAAVGGLLTGLVGRLVTRSLTTRPLPVWGVRGLRGLGGVGCGWLVYLYVMSTGSGGLGGGGGHKPGSADDGSGKVARQPEEKDAKKKKPPDTPAARRPLRVEVLGPKALKVLKQPAGDAYRGYRIEGEEDQTLYDLKGITARLKSLEKTAPRPVILVIYLDSPNRDRPIVSELADWLTEEKIKWKFDETRDYSPEMKRSMP